MISRLHKKMEPVIEYKKENGWIKNHIRVMDESWKWVISLDDLPINVGIGGFKGSDDKNRKMMQDLGDIIFTHLDEDTHWDIRVLMFMYACHKRWSELEQSVESAHQIMNFGNLYRDLLELSKPLPLDDGKGKDDIYDIDMRSLERDKDALE